MRPAWHRAPACLPLLPLLLPLLPLLLAGMTAPAAAEPCLDRLGRLHREGDVFYDFPDSLRPCIIYKCVDDQRKILKDRCSKKTAKVSPFMSSKSSLQPTSAHFLQLKSSLQTRNITALVPSKQHPSSQASALPPPSASSSIQSEPASAPAPPEPTSAPTSAPSPAVPTFAAVSRRNSSLLSRMTVSVCMAQNDRRYFEGQQWWESTRKPCEQYVCRSSRSLLVHNVTCPPLPSGCSGRPVFGQCCPEPTNCEAPQTCSSSSGQTYREGQTWLETDARPCSRYTCFSGRRLRIQNVTCDPPNALCRRQLQLFGQCCQEQTQCGCLEPDTVPPRERLDGEQWPSVRDPCVTLRCDEGQIGEQRRPPQPQPCPPPADSSCQLVPPPLGVCACPTYQCKVLRPCVSGGVPYAHGSRWQIGTCIIGSCHDGVVHRAPVTCPQVPADCIPVHDPATCCPTCQHSTTPTPATTPLTTPPTTPPTTPVTTPPTTPVTTPPTTPPTTPFEVTITTTQRPDNSCEFDGTIYLNEENWQNQCGSHVCFNGKVVSQYVYCPGPTGVACAPIHQPGSCCVRWSCQSAAYLTICSRDSSAQNSQLCYKPGKQEGVCKATSQPLVDSCCPVFECLKNCQDFGGESHYHGSSWEENCNIYSCDNGTASSKVKDCPPPGNAQCHRTNPEDCCPIYDCDCSVDGEHRTDGAHWTSGCNELWCKRGAVDSRHVPCPDPPRPDCVSLPVAGGQCCPGFECSCVAVSCPPIPTEPGCERSGTSADGCCTLYSCAGDCQDDQRRVHTDGSRWYVKCTRYKCSGGNITEEAYTCEPAPSSDCKAVYLPNVEAGESRDDEEDDGGQLRRHRSIEEACCPFYDCPPPACTPGESFFDGCNFCECFSPGLLRCTLIFCEEKSCSHLGQTHNHNGNWTLETAPCLVYSCVYGIILNWVTQCPPKPGPLCEKKPPVAGQCCPEWDCSAEGPCREGVTEPRSWEDGCNVCTCSDSGVVCTDFNCHKGCQHLGQKYDFLEVIPSPERCKELMCIGGETISIYESCLLKPDFTCREIELDDQAECCSHWICDDLPGIPSRCNIGAIYQGDLECMYCECSAVATGVPEMICTKRDCLNTGCDDGGTYHEHGSVWAAADLCRQNVCVSGEVVGLVVQCPPPPGGACVPVPDSNRCCPLYYCGEKCEDGATSQRDCNSCYCKEGVQFCTTRQCDDGR